MILEVNKFALQDAIESVTLKGKYKNAASSKAGRVSDTIVAIIESTDSLAYTSRLAKMYATKAQQALELLPPSDHREALSKLAEFAVSRTY